MTDDRDDIVRRLRSAERSSRLSLVLTVALAVVVVFTAGSPGDGTLRTRGIVVTDAEGRERIVIGAPLGNATEHPLLGAAAGVVVLDSMGRLQVALGSENPLVTSDGQLGRRIAEASGLTIYDPRTGQERGGMSAFRDGRANLCLDYEGDKEAACLTVAVDDDYAAVVLNGPPNEDVFDRVAMYVDKAGNGILKAFGGPQNRSGVMIRGGDGPARIDVYDRDQKVLGNIADSRAD